MLMPFGWRNRNTGVGKYLSPSAVVLVLGNLIAIGAEHKDANGG